MTSTSLYPADPPSVPKNATAGAFGPVPIESQKVASQATSEPAHELGQEGLPCCASQADGEGPIQGEPEVEPVKATEAEHATQAEARPRPLVTAPESFGVSLRGFPNEEDARRLGSNLGEVVRELSRYFEMSRLDGITVAVDYPQALAELDRGYATKHVLTRTEGAVVGVAMTPSVIREGVLKSHILFNAQFIWALRDQHHVDHHLALHVVAHECAHVEVTSAFDKAFPNTLLQHSFDNLQERARSDVMLACWDEYAVTQLSARVGADPTQGYEDTLIAHMASARDDANAAIRSYRIHGDVERVYREVYGVYGNLLKYASYCLGNMSGRELTVSERPALEAALAGHWFAPYFDQLEAACAAIAAEYGSWQDQHLFDVIGDIGDALVLEGGLEVTAMEDGRLYIDVPFTAETMP